jgi:hypothetical protein
MYRKTAVALAGTLAAFGLATAHAQTCSPPPGQRWVTVSESTTARVNDGVPVPCTITQAVTKEEVLQVNYHCDRFQVIRTGFLGTSVEPSFKLIDSERSEFPFYSSRDPRELTISCPNSDRIETVRATLISDVVKIELLSVTRKILEAKPRPVF